MLIAFIISIFLTWLAFMGLGMSFLMGNATGMFWYGMAMMVFGAIAKFVLDRD